MDQSEVQSMYPMDRSVRSQAIKDVAAAAARLSILHTRTWCVPAKTEANPTMQVISAIRKNVSVILLPAHMTTSPDKACSVFILHPRNFGYDSRDKI